MIGKKTCDKGLTTEGGKKAFLTAETGHRRENSIKTSSAATTFCSSCMAIFHHIDNRKPNI